MALKHRITINVSCPEGDNKTILQGASLRVPERILKFFFGEFTQVYLLKPGQSVQSVDVKELAEGGAIV